MDLLLCCVSRGVALLSSTCYNIMVAAIYILLQYYGRGYTYILLSISCYLYLVIYILLSTVLSISCYSISCYLYLVIFYLLHVLLQNLFLPDMSCSFNVKNI